MIKLFETGAFLQNGKLIPELQALAPLGKEYTDTLCNGLLNGWVDRYENKGKRSGAYSSGFYDTNPFVLLNYEGKLKDVSTLAHELGHSMHTYYSCQNNPYNLSSYNIFVAEVASTVNELLLVKYLLKKSEKKEEQLFLLNKLLELYKGTIYRQVMFAEFERDMHKANEEGEVLTYDYLNENYYKLLLEYQDNDRRIDYSWITDLDYSSLHNGLDEEDNKKLFVTPFADEAIYLISKGLHRLC